MNFLGHFFKVFKLIVVKGLEEPYDVIFKELNYGLITDSLTGLFNRRGFIEFFERIIKKQKWKIKALAFS
ncbi:MAG TPA: hypothetical protein DEA47_04090 [Peptococcaceae bacterium]|nr:hypothetical protein [Peptococcaceae bacterium]